MSKIHEFLLENVHLPVDAWTAESVAGGMQQIAQIRSAQPSSLANLNADLNSDYQFSKLRPDFTGPNFRHGALNFPTAVAVAGSAALLAMAWYIGNETPIRKADRRAKGNIANEGLGNEPKKEVQVVESTPIVVVHDGYYAAFNDETVIDMESRLMWTRRAAPQLLKWNDADQYCRGLVMGGRDNWRLPSIRQLKGLIEGCGSMDSCEVGLACLTLDCLPRSGCLGCVEGGGVHGGTYWKMAVFDEMGSPTSWYASSSKIIGEPDGFWVVGFHRGQTSNGSVNTKYAVRCVTKEPEEKRSAALNVPNGYKLESQMPATTIVRSNDDGDNTSTQGKAEPQQRGMADRVIDYGIDRVTPESTGTIREVQRDAVRFLLDPNSERSERHLDNMINGIRKISEGEEEEE